MSAATATQSAPPIEVINAKRVAAYIAAGKRAAAAHMVAYLNADGSYSVPSTSEPGREHIVTVIGPRYFDLSCDCKGAGHLACTHRYVAGVAVRYHVHAKRPEVTTPAAADDSDTDQYVADSDDEQYRQESIMQALVDQGEHEIRRPFAVDPTPTAAETAWFHRVARAERLTTARTWPLADADDAAEMAAAEAWLMADPTAEIEAHRVARNARFAATGLVDGDQTANTCPICKVRPSVDDYHSLCIECRDGRLAPARAALDAEIAAGLNPLEVWA